MIEPEAVEVVGTIYRGSHYLAVRFVLQGVPDAKAIELAQTRDCLTFRAGGQDLKIYDPIVRVPGNGLVEISGNLIGAVIVNESD